MAAAIGRELRVPIADQEPQPSDPILEVHQQGAGLLRSRLTGGMGGDALDVLRADANFNHQEHVGPVQPHGCDAPSQQP